MILDKRSNCMSSLQLDKWLKTCNLKKKQIPYPPSGWPINWRTIIPKKFSYCCEGLENHFRLPTWGPDKGTGNLQGIWPWSPAGFDYNTSTGLRETGTPVVEGTNKTLCIPSLREKEQWLHRKLSQTTC